MTTQSDHDAAMKAALLAFRNAPIGADRLEEACRAYHAHLAPLVRAEALKAEREWRPIESAPKSTSKPVLGGMSVKAVYLLGYCPDESAVDPASCICVVWWEPHLDGGCWQGEGDIRMRPTHWQPLPPAPDAT